ncbi:MAG TPA: polyphosphate kinase 1 [Bacteroidales bacterium]|nr:polyphosphate kinase 1 [Bacteroidales bacterium]
MEIIDREISWLHFNSRLLQEAANNDVPLLERLRFLGIYSNNLDEFYRVRVASINRLIEFNKKNYPEKVEESEKLHDEIYKYIKQRQNEFSKVKDDIFNSLQNHGVFVINEKQLSEDQEIFVRNYFFEQILPGLFTIRLNRNTNLGSLSDGAIYLGVILRKKDCNKKDFALIQIPTNRNPRFIEIPDPNTIKTIIRLDDIIRFCLKDIFGAFNYSGFEAYTIKITRDAEIDLYGNVSRSFIDIIADSVKKRKTGTPVRVIYDKNMPEEMIETLVHCFKIKDLDNLIKGERYHNSKDYMNFPLIEGKQFVYDPLIPISHRHIDNKSTILSSVRKRDILLHYPYNSFNYIINMLREASIDPKVRSIKITLYRLANDSKIISALINAANNGKSVTAFLELKARFEEEQNIYWTNQLEEAGVKIIKTIPGIKVHAKMILIRAKEKGENVYYANISTGNFNERTAKIYSDVSLITADQRICLEVGQVFYLIESAYQIISFDHLLVSPLYTRKKLLDLIENEIISSRKGLDAWIDIKVNSITDPVVIDKLNEAAESGVKLRLSVRASCSLIPAKNKNVTAVGIVDRFLEHSRIFIFCNGGDNLYFIGSSDMMIRNLDTRIEVTSPIYDKTLQKELKQIMDIQFLDNITARDWSSKEKNSFALGGKDKVRTQEEIYNFLEKLNNYNNDICNC